MFELKESYYMQYQGIITIGNTRKAIFNCPKHNEGAIQGNFFEQPVQYRYAFYLVEVKGVFNCFLVGETGFRDIQLDDLKLLVQKI